MAGVSLRSKKTEYSSDPLAGNYGAYNAGVGQNAEDYDSIMAGYKQLLAQNQQNTANGRNAGQVDPNSLRRLQPKTYDYQQSAASRDSIANLGELSKTGGYSEANIADLRARGISPIRAVYANAQRNIARSKSLQGGYSPNSVAASSRMAREQSDLTAGAVQNVNAGIAQNVASNRLAAASPYAQAAGSESALRNEYGRRNVDAEMDADRFNIGNEYDLGKFNAANLLDFNKNRNNTGMGALQGMTSLYGTTPALANTFGNQALSAAQMQSNNINSSNQTGFQASSAIRRKGRLG